MFSLFNDLTHAARTLGKARAFTAVCVISLGLGMSVVIAMLLLFRMVTSTPPGVHDDGLVELVVRPSGALQARAGADLIDTWSYADYLDVRDGSSGLTLTGWARGDGLVRLPGQSAPLALPTMYVSSNYFSTLGVSLARGRGFTPADDASVAEREAVISHRMWQVRLDGDPNIIGRTIVINQAEFVVVGVAPEKFRGHTGGLDDRTHQLWLQLSRHPRLTTEDGVRRNRDAAWIHIVGRLAEGTTLGHADGSVRAVMAGLAARYPASNADKAGSVEPYSPLGARLRAQSSFGRMVASGLAGVVLLVVGLNISGMMLVRSAMRERELAIRLALGAGRWRLMRYHFSEALVLAVVGGAFASALLFGIPVVVAWAFNLWGPEIDIFTPDAWLVLQCIGLCFVTSLVLGLLPALRFSRPSVVAALKNDSAGSRRVGGLQRLTAAAQAGLAVPLLVIGGLNLDRARVTATADLGFQPRGLYAARLNLTDLVRTEADRQAFLQRVQETLAQAPGVAAVTLGDGIPLDFDNRFTRVARERDSTFVPAHTTRVAAGYMETVAIRMLAGRAIEAGDRDGGELVVVLSDPLARRLFPAGDAIGQRVDFALVEDERRTYTVVGITADLVSTQMGNPRPQLFVSLAQHPATSVLAIARGATADPSMRRRFESAIAEALRPFPRAGAADAAPAGEYVVSDLITGDGQVEISHSDLLMQSGVSGLLASVALVLAALGVYGVIAFMVATRTREIGVRLALGASRFRVLRDVLGDALKLVLPGIGVGLVLAVGWVRVVDPSWYPLGGVEPFIYAVAAATAFLVAVLAGVPSARRAAGVQPIVAMRTE
jgi:putative ABC transport system permease protein